jgi:hypothetical protein
MIIRTVRNGKLEIALLETAVDHDLSNIVLPVFYGHRTPHVYQEDVMLSSYQCRLHEVMGQTDNISMELPPIGTGVEEAVLFTLQIV